MYNTVISVLWLLRERDDNTIKNNIIILLIFKNIVALMLTT
jgi:hypothetical protein